MNGLYDVNNNLANTAVVGFTEWSQFYARYRVNMCAIKVTFVNPTNNPVYVGLTARPHNQSTMANWTQAREQEGNKWSKTAFLGIAGSGKDTKTLSLVVPLGSFMGNKLGYKADDAYSALTTANPSRLLECVPWVGSYDGASNHGVIPFKATLTFYVTLWDRINLIS